MPLRRQVLLALLLLLPLPALSAGPTEQLAARLTTLQATVLSERNGEILLDAGSAVGVSPLDLFAVSGPGTPVVHPQTGALLGEVSETKAVLQVTWVKENFSGTRRVRGEAQLAGGDKAMRFSDLEARFVACATDAETLFADLRRQLPTLRWGSYQKAEDCADSVKLVKGADLLFLASATEISARDASGNLLQSFDRITPSTTLPSSTAPVAPGQERWYGGDWKGAPTAMAAGDFDGDGKTEVAVADPRHITLGRTVKRSWQELGKMELPVTHRVLAVEACDVDNNGTAELCISASRDNALSSFLYAWRDGRLVELQKGLPWMLRVLDDGNGKPTLYGQELDNGQWSGPARQLDWDGVRLVASAPLSLPAGTGLRGLAHATVDGRPALLRLGWNDALEVLDIAGEKLWQSKTSYGGSETYLEVAGDQAHGRDHNTRNLYVQQRLQAITADQVLVPVNVGSRAFNRMISYNESQVQLVHWDGRALRVVWQTPQEKGYLADCTWADIDNDGKAELLMLMAYSKEGIFSKGRYSLVVLEM